MSLSWHEINTILTPLKVGESNLTKCKLFFTSLLFYLLRFFRIFLDGGSERVWEVEREGRRRVTPCMLNDAG